MYKVSHWSRIGTKWIEIRLARWPTRSFTLKVPSMLRTLCCLRTISYKRICEGVGRTRRRKWRDLGRKTRKRFSLHCFIMFLLFATSFTKMVQWKRIILFPEAIFPGLSIIFLPSIYYYVAWHEWNTCYVINDARLIACESTLQHINITSWRMINIPPY